MSSGLSGSTPPSACQQGFEAPKLRRLLVRRWVAGLTIFLSTQACDGRLNLGAEPAQDRAATSGFVVWESNRSGAFRIWRQELAGGAPRRISPDEPGRDHCCAKLSPNGQRLVYLSLPGGSRTYSPARGELHLVDSDGGRDRVLIPSARHYGEHRAAVWWDLDRLLYLDGDGSTRLRTLSTGTEEVLARIGPTGEGWLIAPGGRVATGNTPTFSDWSPAGGVVEHPSLGGCQPAFSADGRRAVWSAGAGGPIDAIDFERGESWTILGKNDPRVPADRGYLYFPMLSADATLLAVAGSAGEHDHFRADYDILVVDLDPATLLPLGEARRIAPDPAVDRYPDPFRGAASADAGTAARPRPAAPAAATPAPDLSLVFAWNPPGPAATASRRPPGILRPSGAVWLDRNGGMALAGGRFAADRSLAERITGELRDTNQLSLVVRFAPASLDQSGPIVALSDGGRRRNFTLRQRQRTIELVLRTSDTAREGRVVPVAELTATAPVTLGLRFTPGRLTIFRDGSAGETVPFPGDFFPWRPAEFTVGAEGGSHESFRGTVAQFSLWSRALGDTELTGALARVRQATGSSTVHRVDAEVRVLETTAAPELAAIAPYREALVVDRVEVLRVLSGSPPAERILRRVRWAILDGHALPVPRHGEIERVVLEPFAAQPQLEPFHLGDTTAGGEAPLWFDLDGSVAP